ncbi:MAG: alanyl-tRNA editing protein [Clostridia bacterium]|nr:alanyl-tRNA editing protein [Clostridia bacterium]
MITKKLYEKDAYISKFNAAVLSCDKAENGYRIKLDKTAFFPEGGGQPADTGTISGVNVFDVQIENDEIFHYTEKPLETGVTASCNLDFDRRYSFMQNHTAEHIVSGLVFKEYGYNNIGFHLNESEVTFDFNGFFTEEQLKKLEYEANKRVWRNLSVTAFYPSSDESVTTSYRAKSGINGKIRLVKIEDTDICACCAPHVNSTGEIGIIKFLNTEKQHGGTRIFMKCGTFALDDYRRKNSDIKAICGMLSAKTENLKDAVVAQSKRLESEKAAAKALRSELINYKIKLFDKTKHAIYLNGADIKQLQMAADGLHKAYGGVKTALCENENGCAFVMCGDTGELETEFKKLKDAFAVRGGGRDKIRQGSIIAEVEEIKQYFEV